jgi:hypothetical protein
LLDELEHATNSLIEGEATMGRALGRLWQVLREDQDERTNGVSLVPKREDEDEDPEEQDDKDRRLARAPDLKPPSYKHFLDAGPPVFDTPQSVSPERQHESLEKSLATLRELEDDGREYVERLEEIREGLGETRDQRNGTWEMVRQKAVKELQDAAFSMSV